MIDITGQRFGMLLALAPCGGYRHEMRWHCRCDCGAAHITRGSLLRKGRAKSCGCRKSALSRATALSLPRRFVADGGYRWMRRQP